jgi:hypothetical protein
MDINEGVLRAIEHKLNGFIADDERINEEGVKARQLLSMVLPVP